MWYEKQKRGFMEINTNFSFHDNRFSKDIFREQINLLCVTIEQNGSLSDIFHQIKDLKAQAKKLQTPEVEKELDRLESFLHQNWPLSEMTSLSKLQELKQIFHGLDFKTVL